MTTIDPAAVVKFEIEHGGFVAIVSADPDDVGAFAYPDELDPDGFWVCRVPCEVRILSETVAKARHAC